MPAPQHTAPVLQVRVALTTRDYARLVRFYTIGLGFQAAEEWTNDNDRGLMIEMGQASLEIFDEGYAAHVDQWDASHTVSGKPAIARYLQTEIVTVVRMRLSLVSETPVVYDPRTVSS